MSATGHPDLRERFAAAIRAVGECARPGEITTGWLRAEISDFVRFNHGQVRQAGTVDKAAIELRLIRDARQASLLLTLSGIAADDVACIGAAFAQLRELVGQSEPDPFLALSDRPVQARTVLPGDLPEAREVGDTVCSAAGDADLVGFYAGGPLACGFVSSLGHDLWHESRPWFFDYCVYTAGDKAVKATVADAGWQPARVGASVARARREAAILHRPLKVLAPGAYRAYLSPAALAEIAGMMNWGGFSASAQMSGHSPLARLKSGHERFSPMVSLTDDLATIGVPRFQSDGFQRPDRLDLVRDGGFANALVSPRSAREFALPGTGATVHETAEALCMAGGDLDEQQALRRLGTGVSVSNFWYLNWSDRSAARLTGMTRFATLWVEDGEPVAPLSVMRFDDSLFRMLGSALEALTRTPDRIPDTQTYENRSFGAAMAPGALLSALDFTL